MHRHKVLLALALLSGATTMGQQTNSAVAQTARQALIEMFFSKTPGTLVKHLPAATLAALAKSDAITSLQQYSSMATQMQTQGHDVQTFDTGSVLLSGEDPKTGEKFEITVENDALRDDQDDIELSFQIYKNGQPQHTPYMPQVTFSMKEEAHIWKLNEISVTIHLPLADPDLLKALTQQMKPQLAAQSAFTPHTESPSQAAGSDAMVVAAMRTILAAEATYAGTYKNVGYTCSLSSLIAVRRSAVDKLPTNGRPQWKQLWTPCLLCRSDRIYPIFSRRQPSHVSGQRCVTTVSSQRPFLLLADGRAQLRHDFLRSPDRGRMLIDVE